MGSGKGTLDLNKTFFAHKAIRTAPRVLNVIVEDKPDFLDQLTCA
jgi:hypothetical protein